MVGAPKCAGGRGEGRVSEDTVVSSADVPVALLNMSLCCGSTGRVAGVPA